MRTFESLDGFDGNGDDSRFIHSHWNTMKCGINIMQMLVLVMTHE